MKIGYQLKQVRERLAKGLVDKGILRTEKRNFLLFDMATHPVVDSGAKDEIRKRVRNVCSQRTVVLPPSQFLPQEMDFRYIRTISMVCASYAANVLENALVTMSHEARERAFAQVDELLAEYSQWPFGKRAGGQQGIGANIGQAISDEVEQNKDKELQLEASLVTRLPLMWTLLTRHRSLQHASACLPDWIHCCESQVISTKTRLRISELKLERSPCANPYPVGVTRSTPRSGGLLLRDSIPMLNGWISMTQRQGDERSLQMSKVTTPFVWVVRRSVSPNALPVCLEQAEGRGMYHKAGKRGDFTVTS
jgi:Golgi phosphoprotein 3 (GPP34)